MKRNLAQADEEIMALIAEIEMGYWQANPELHSLCQQLINICKAHRHSMLGYAYFLFGRTHLIFGQLDHAMPLLKKSIALVKKESILYLATVLLWHGVANFKKREYAKALKFWMDALVQAHEKTQLEVAIEIHLNISQLYQMAEKKEECSAILRSGLALAVVTNNKKLIAKSCIFLSDALIRQAEYSAALSVIDQSESDVVLYGDLTWVVQLCKSKGICFYRQKDIAPCVVCFESGLAIAKKFNLNWALIDISLAYAELLLMQKNFDLLERILVESAAALEFFPEDDFKESWHRLNYICHKERKQTSVALQELKINFKLQQDRLKNSFLDASHEEVIIRLENAYPVLRRDFKRFERLAGVTNLRLGVNSYLRFRERCKEQLGNDRVIELFIRPHYKIGLNKLMIEVLNEYCASNDIWIVDKDGHYYIYPASQEKSLHNFSMVIADVLKEQFMARLNLKNIQIRTRLLSTSTDLLEKVNGLIERGWHES